MQPKARGHGVGSARESPAWAQIAAVVPEPREAEGGLNSRGRENRGQCPRSRADPLAEGH